MGQKRSVLKMVFCPCFWRELDKKDKKKKNVKQKLMDKEDMLTS